jgi:DNA-binding beta-propeller fold protein YncE
VVNADTGQVVATAPTGVGTGVIEFDSGRNLLYAANGSGTLSIIRQHVTDSYRVIQSLDTSRWARVLAVDPSTGEVYVVTDFGESGLAVLVVGH